MSNIIWTAEKAETVRQRVIKKLKDPTILGVYKGQILGPFFDPQILIDDLGLKCKDPDNPLYRRVYISETFPGVEIEFRVPDPLYDSDIPLIKETVVGIEISGDFHEGIIRLPNIHFAGIRIGDTFDRVREKFKALGYTDYARDKDQAPGYFPISDKYDRICAHFHSDPSYPDIVESIHVSYENQFDAGDFTREPEQNETGYEIDPNTRRIKPQYDIYSPQVAPYL